MKIYTFDSTGDAYDECQTNDEIKDGDLLWIPSESVVGIADTWPLAITVESGNLHTAHEGHLDFYVAEHFPAGTLEAARELALKHGYPIQES